MNIHQWRMTIILCFKNIYIFFYSIERSQMFVVCERDTDKLLYWPLITSSQPYHAVLSSKFHLAPTSCLGRWVLNRRLPWLMPHGRSPWLQLTLMQAFTNSDPHAAFAYITPQHPRLPINHIIASTYWHKYVLFRDIWLTVRSRVNM